MELLRLYVRGVLEAFEKTEKTLWSPKTYGSYALVFRTVFRISLFASVVAAFLMAIITKSLLFSLLVLAFVISFPYLASQLFRVYLGFALEKDMPIIMSLLLPLARFSSNVADAVLYLDFQKLPFSLRFEVYRLRIFMNLGLDPVSALRALASATPSKSFGDFLREYLNSVIIGGPKTDVTAMFLKEAIQKTRDQWRLFFSVSKTASEIIATAVVSMPVLVPLMILSRTDWHIAIIAMALFSVASSFALLTLRPRVGSVERREALGYICIICLAISSVVSISISLELGLALLAFFTLVTETYAVKMNLSVSRATTLLREALEESRIGFLNWSKLREVQKSILSSVIDAILTSSTIAGTTRIHETLVYIYELHEEVRRNSAQAKRHGLALATLKTVALVITIYFLISLANMSAGLRSSIEVNPLIVKEIAKTLVALTPILLLPSAIVYREWLPSLSIPLASFVFLYLVMTFVV
ncbi:MAG: hypothetical protein QXE20_04595 [Acidilobaceae archaeon]